MDSGAVNINEVLVIASLVLVFGGFWHWMGWMRWPTEPARKPLGRMMSLDAPIAVGVYIGSVVFATILLLVYMKVRDLVTQVATTQATQPGMVELNINELLLLQVMSSVPIVIYFLLRCFPRKGEADRQTGFETKGLGKLVLVGVAVGVTVMPLILLFNVGLIELANRLFDVPRPADGHDLLQKLRLDPSVGNYVGISVLVVIVAPVVEELLFRGVIQGSLREYGRATAVFVSSILFALVHVGGVPWQVLPALAFLGVVLGLLFERTGVLWPNIFAHAAFNASNILLSLLYVNQSP